MPDIRQTAYMFYTPVAQNHVTNDKNYTHNLYDHHQ